MKPVLIWDWDGTLVDTLTYKYRGIWNEVFPGDNIKQNTVIAYIKSQKGRTMNRYGLICHALATTDAPEILKLRDETLKSDERVKAAARRYDVATKTFVYENGLCKGVKVVLKDLWEEGYRMYLISGGGTDGDLQEMLRFFNIEKYFISILGFGSPGTPLVRFGKYNNFVRVTDMEKNSKASNYVIIGDSKTDHELANKVGSHFIGIVNKWNGWGNTKRDFATVLNVIEILDILRGLSPAVACDIVGKKVKTDIPIDEQIRYEDLS